MENEYTATTLTIRILEKPRWHLYLHLISITFTSFTILHMYLIPCKQTDPKSKLDNYGIRGNPHSFPATKINNENPHNLHFSYASTYSNWDHIAKARTFFCFLLSNKAPILRTKIQNPNHNQNKKAEISKKKKKKTWDWEYGNDRREGVAGVGNQHAGLPDSTISDRDTLDKPWSAHLLPWKKLKKFSIFLCFGFRFLLLQQQQLRHLHLRD